MEWVSMSHESTLSKRQASRAVKVEAAPSLTKSLECNARAVNASAAALRVAQSELERHSWMLCSKGSKLWAVIAPTCKCSPTKHIYNHKWQLNIAEWRQTATGTSLPKLYLFNSIASHQKGKGSKPSPLLANMLQNFSSFFFPLPFLSNGWCYPSFPQLFLLTQRIKMHYP